MVVVVEEPEKEEAKKSLIEDPVEEGHEPVAAEPEEHAIKTSKEEMKEEVPEPLDKPFKPKKMVDDGPIEKPAQEEPPSVDPKVAFVSEVESLLSTKIDDTKDTKEDDKEKFLKDVESLLSKKKKVDDE